MKARLPLPIAVALCAAVVAVEYSGAASSTGSELRRAVFSRGTVQVEPKAPDDVELHSDGSMLWKVAGRMFTLGPMHQAQKSAHRSSSAACHGGYPWPVKPFDRQHP